MKGQPFTSAWRDLWRRRVVATTAALTFFLTAIVNVVLRNSHAPAQVTTIVEAFFFVSGIVALSGTIWSLKFRCPRCGKFFMWTKLWTNLWTRRCLHCHLQMGTHWAQ
jgi:hypothetical protein